MIRFINLLLGLLELKLVKDERPYLRDENPRTDEGWDDILEPTPRYRIVRRKKRG